MSKKKNRRQREQARQQRELAAPPALAEVQTPAPAIVADEAQQARDREIAALKQIVPIDPSTVPSWGQEPAKPARKFGKPKVFDLGCGITVTIKGDDETLETEFWPVFEGNELHLYSGDAALDRRIAKQQGAVIAPSHFIPAPPIPATLTSAEAPVSDSERYERALARRGGDPEQAAFDALGLGGINVNTMKQSTTIGAQLAAVPDEEIA